MTAPTPGTVPIAPIRSAIESSTDELSSFTWPKAISLDGSGAQSKLGSHFSRRMAVHHELHDLSLRFGKGRPVGTHASPMLRTTEPLK